MIAIGKLSKKYQATIPASVRQLLHLDAGNEVHLRKTRPMDLALTQSLEGTINEWVSGATEEAYRAL